MYARTENSAASTIHRTIKIHFLRQGKINSLNSHTILITKTFYVYNLNTYKIPIIWNRHKTRRQVNVLNVCFFLLKKHNHEPTKKKPTNHSPAHNKRIIRYRRFSRTLFFFVHRRVCTQIQDRVRRNCYIEIYAISIKVRKVGLRDVFNLSIKT